MCNHLVSLLQDKAAELKLLEQEDELKKKKIEEEIKKQEQIVIQQARISALNKYRREYKNYYGERITSIANDMMVQCFNVLNAIEKVLQENRETLRTIDENHEKIIAGVCDNSEIKDSITAINELLKDCFDSLEKQVVIQDSKTSEAIIEKICNLIKCVDTMTEIIPASAQNLRNAVENIEKSIKDESSKLYNAVDTLHIDYTEFRRQEENDFAIVIENTTSVSEKLQIQVNHLEELKNEIIETLRSIEQRIEGVNLLPGKISESVERLITKFEKTVDSIQSDYKNLADDIEDQEKARTKKFNSIMTEIRDLSEESNEEMAEEIKKLAEQYESFEKMISAIVDQMSHMAEEDIKVMKGFLNG